MKRNLVTNNRPGKILLKTVVDLLRLIWLSLGLFLFRFAKKILELTIAIIRTNELKD